MSEMKGEKGDPGRPGAEGRPGSEGRAGTTGMTGSTGEEGPKGVTGEEGPEGPSPTRRLFIMFCFVVVVFVLLSWRGEVRDRRLDRQDDQIQMNKLIDDYERCVGASTFIEEYNKNLQAQAMLEREEASIFPDDTPEERRIGKIHAELAELLLANRIDLPDCGDDPRKK